MILIGTTHLSRTVDQGQFQCPTCEVVEGYRLRERRPWLTLYFIPILPLASAEPTVVCDTCNTHWDPAVLDGHHPGPSANLANPGDSVASEEETRLEILRACVLLVVATEAIDDDEINVLIQVGADEVDIPITREELGQLCSQAMSAQVAPHDYLASICHRWTKPYRRLALRCLFLVASAGNGIEEIQLQTLSRAKDLFQLTDPEYRSIIDEATN